MSIDPIIKDHQLWIGFVQPEGLVVSPHALKNAQAILSRNVTVQQEILRRHTIPDVRGSLRLKSFPAFTQEFWGWRESDLAAPPDDLSARLPEYGETLRPSWVVRGGKGQPEHLILIQELQPGTEFDTAAQHSEEQRWHASPQARFERLLRETGVAIGLLVSPERIRLVYAPKGESSGHLTFPVHQMTMAANWPMLAALHLLLHSDRLFIGPEAQRLSAILEASRRYQNEVSIRLAGQVLRALNELVRGFQDADRAAHGAILKEVLEQDPNHIYGGLLTTLMRMVFVLYAEDRSLMGSDETWLQNYSISGLHERLRADAGQYPDTMDSRYGAWAQILTLTRLLYDGGGHGSWRVPARHGGLFDPDAYPFLEGRPWGSKRASAPGVEPPLVSDGVLFRILQDLLYLDGERISYRALDVEQIGSVYEAMMGFTVETAHGTSIGLGSENLVIDLEELLRKKPGDRAKWLKENASSDVTGKASEQLKSAATVDELLAALRRRISKLYLDQNSNPIPVPAGGIYLQPTEERRRSGSHYTPRSLTQPIVKTTLDPVIAQLGDNPKPEQILALKVCDPAMGSGAFLVEACRYLGEKLEKAWIAHNETPPIPADQDPLLHARRMVAQRCLYGVDKNPFAVNLAKLSLWLATFAKDHPFTFVDHTLRCGDSLVGLTARQIEAFHWQPKEEGALLRDLPSRLQHVLESRAQILHAADETPYDTLVQKLAVTEQQMVDIRLAGDLAVAAFFGADKPKDREIRRKELAEAFRRAQERITDLELDTALERIVRDLHSGREGVTPFHWEIEFPEVFQQSHGFSCLIGNPPFLGGRKISGAFGRAYVEYLYMAFPGAANLCDLVAYFFRRAFDFLSDCGTLGLLATKTIAEGDTRVGGLEYIRRIGGLIFSATRRIVWPGEATVIVSVVHIARGGPIEECFLDGHSVEIITSFLFSSGGDSAPVALPGQSELFSQGSKIYGQGFLFDDHDEKASPMSRLEDLIAEEPQAASRIFPYIGGEEITSSPAIEPKRHVIDLSDVRVEDDLKQWPVLTQIVRERVKPYRDSLNDTAVNRPLRRRWWAYQAHRPAFYAQARLLPRILATPEVSTHLIFVFLPTKWIYSHKLNLFLMPQSGAFAILQSRIHESFVKAFSGSRGDGINYSCSDCFEPFPFPVDWALNATLEEIGDEYYQARADFMGAHNCGLTDLYNRFHDKADQNVDLQRMRALHGRMDRAVLDAYGWTDLQPAYGYILDYVDGGDDEPTAGRKRKEAWRYRWSDDFRDELLGRLLALNEARRGCGPEDRSTLPLGQQKVTAPRKHAGTTANANQGNLYEEPAE